jgi:hypothetical protein
VDWNDDALPTPRHDENMVTPLDPDQAPTLPLNDPRQVFARNLFHRANSMTRSFCAIPLSLVSTEATIRSLLANWKLLPPRSRLG